MIILIHTSKTMRPAENDTRRMMSKPTLHAKATELAEYLKTLSVKDIEKTMKISEKLAITTKELLSGWNDDQRNQRPAIDSFLGDVYSGLQVVSLTEQDRLYADEHLRILSGLYGILKPLDGIYPYRYEMGYKMPDHKYRSMYTFWETSIFATLAENETIINLSAVEYGKTVTNYAKSAQIVTPRFLTESQKAGPNVGTPIFVVIHAKIARGAYAGWIIRNRIDDVERLKEFAEIGYEYIAGLSTPEIPVFVCKEFQGFGLSVRLT